eukprot:scaffold5532_cov263-Pinguiococcus_pyrenoidosus.AAC.9
MSSAEGQAVVVGDGKVPLLQKVNPDYQWFVRADVDSFAALFFDNFASLFGILSTMAFTIPLIVGVDADKAQKMEEIVFERIAPGAAFAIIFGNLYYAWMAGKLAGYEQRTDVTALPYGINTPASFIMAFSVMLPLAFRHADEEDPDEFAEKVWRGTASATFLTGLFECSGFWIGNFIRRHTVKAALYAPIAAVGFVYLALDPFINVGGEPIIGLVPLALAMTGFFANGGKGIYKSGATAVLIFGIGTILKWLGAGKTNPTPENMADDVEDAWDTYAGENRLLPGESLRGLEDIEDFVTIIFPVAIQSFIETMENVEAAAAKGDHYNLKEAMIVDGLGSSIGAFFGSALPTTVYIGHARHKTIGARAGYSIINAVSYFILLNAGLYPVLFEVIDSVSIGVVLLFVGLIIVQQSFEVSNSRHYPPLCIGIFCVLIDYIRLEIVEAGGSNIRLGVLNISPGGGIVASLVLTQILCDLIDCRFDRAGIYCAIAVVLSLFGIMHGNNQEGPIDDDMLEPGELTVSTIADDNARQSVNEGWRFCIAYTMVAAICFLHWLGQRAGWFPEPIMDNGVSAHAVPVHKGEKDQAYQKTLIEEEKATRA